MGFCWVSVGVLWEGVWVWVLWCCGVEFCRSGVGLGDLWVYCEGGVRVWVLLRCNVVLCCGFRVGVGVVLVWV